MHLNMLVIAGIEQMGGKLAGTAALAAFEDHGSTLNPKADSSAWRMRRTSSQAWTRACSVSGETGKEPLLADFANWLRLLDSLDWPSAASSFASDC